MGMKRRKCDRCGKARAFEEGTGKSGTGPACFDGNAIEQLTGHVSRTWADRPEGKVCCWCVKRETPAPDQPGPKLTVLGPKAWRKAQKKETADDRQ